jgi:hypothetical protein
LLKTDHYEAYSVPSDELRDKINQRNYHDDVVVDVFHKMGLSPARQDRDSDVVARESARKIFMGSRSIC